MSASPSSTGVLTLDEIRGGLEKREFFLEYLPVHSVADGHCVGAEALVRWRRAGGVVPPADFIPIAENTSLSGLITYWVIDTVAAELGGWLRAQPAAHLSINVPPEILGRGGLEHAAAKAGILDLAPRIVLEITERGVPDLQAVRSFEMNWLGVKTALDDVTLVGGANLAILARCAFDIIKLDRSLIEKVGNERPPEWLGAIKALLAASSLYVVAEGVETEAQLQGLRAVGIQGAQGFYFSSPISAAKFIAYHAQRQPR